jgi:ferrous iron transport protein B
MVVALVLRRSVTKGDASGFIMELPRYQMPAVKDLLIGLWQRAWVFLRRAGTIIFAATVILWLLLTFPKADPGESQVDASFAGQIAGAMHPVFEPIGFNREMTLALVPAMAAREVAVSSLATTYAVDSEDEDATSAALEAKVAALWSLPTALAFLAWFVFAPQCISTIAVARRETNGWKWPLFMVAYLFGLAYLFAGLTYWGAVALGL